MALTHDQLKKLKPPTRAVPIDEMAEGEVVLVRMQASDGLAAIVKLADMSGLADDDLQGAAVRLSQFAQHLLCDENGKPLYGPKDTDAAEIRRVFPLPVLTRVVEEGLKFNGLDEDATKRREAKYTGPLAKRGTKSQGNGAVRSARRKSKRRPRK